MCFRYQRTNYNRHLIKSNRSFESIESSEPIESARPVEAVIAIDWMSMHCSTGSLAMASASRPLRVTGSIRSNDGCCGIMGSLNLNFLSIYICIFIHIGLYIYQPTNFNRHLIEAIQSFAWNHFPAKLKFWMVYIYIYIWFCSECQVEH